MSASSSHPGTPSPPPSIDTTVAHSARIWNYWLGSKDHYAIDREVGEQIHAAFPGIVDIARAQRAFLRRAITYLVREAGLRQFLDIGTGLPTHYNTHEVAQTVAPEARIVYVDNDPLVLAHASALLVGTPEGSTDYIHADLRRPNAILEGARRTLDLNQPVALVLMGVLGHIADDEDPHGIVDELMRELPADSYLALAHDTNAIHGAATDEAVRQWNEHGTPPITLRTPEQIAAFFTGLELEEPGAVSITRWKPDSADIGHVPAVDSFGAVGHKPHHQP